MNEKLTGDEIAKIYSEAMSHNSFHRLLSFFASIAVGFWFLSPLFFRDDLPDWVYYIVSPPVIISILVTLPKHYWVIYKDKRLRRININPFLSMKCAFVAIKPKGLDSNKQHLMQILYYLTLFTPIICFFIMIVLITMK